MRTSSLTFLQLEALREAASKVSYRSLCATSDPACPSPGLQNFLLVGRVLTVSDFSLCL